MNFSNIKDQALKYLGYQGQEIDHHIASLIDECYEEIQKTALFKATFQIFPLTYDPLTIAVCQIRIDYPILNQILANCQEVVIIACTLGLEIDRKLKYYSHVNMTKMTVFDAMASSYLEAMCDDFEKKHFHGKRSFRFCPGYGQVPLELNQQFAKILDCSRRIGLTIQKNHILLPQKSMIGLFGLGDNQARKSCQDCININHCNFRKKGQTCYKTN